MTSFRQVHPGAARRAGFAFDPARLMAGLLALGIAVATPAQAQTGVTPLPRVVVISANDEAEFRPFADAFRQGMRDRRHKEDGSYRLQLLYGNRDPARTLALIRDAAAGRPAVLVVTGLLAARHARDATSTVPVVVTTASDLVDTGVVSSYARPGGNVTGLNDLADELAVKRLEMLKEMVPRASRVALLLNPEFPASPKIERSVRAAARTLGLEVARLDAKDTTSLMAAIDSLAGSRPDALLLGGDAVFVVNARELIARANGMRIPVVHYWPGTAEMGALISHHADIVYNYQRAAFYVDRILAGANPGELPIEQPMRYELVLNRRVAGAFGIPIPGSMLLRADRVLD